MNQFPYTIRTTTPELFAGDLEAGRILLDADDAEAMAPGIGQTLDFFVATAEAGEPAGQVAVRWVNTTSEQLRDVLHVTGDTVEETVPNIAFMEVFEGHQRRGVGRALLDAVYQEARRRGHRRVFSSVAVGNVAARSLYDDENFVDTGFQREMPQYNRQPDGTYGEPVMTTMAYLIRNL